MVKLECSHLVLQRDISRNGGISQPITGHARRTKGGVDEIGRIELVLPGQKERGRYWNGGESCGIRYNRHLASMLMSDRLGMTLQNLGSNQRCVEVLTFHVYLFMTMLMGTLPHPKSQVFSGIHLCH